MKNFKYLAAIGLIGIMSTFLMACGKTDSASNGSNSYAVSDKASSIQTVQVLDSYTGMAKEADKSDGVFYNVKFLVDKAK